MAMGKLYATVAKPRLDPAAVDPIRAPGRMHEAVNMQARATVLHVD